MRRRAAAETSFSLTCARKNKRAISARARARPACACAGETDMRVRTRGRDRLTRQAPGQRPSRLPRREVSMRSFLVDCMCERRPAQRHTKADRNTWPRTGISTVCGQTQLLVVVVVLVLVRSFVLLVLSFVRSCSCCLFVCLFCCCFCCGGCGSDDGVGDGGGAMFFFLSFSFL